MLSPLETPESYVWGGETDLGEAKGIERFIDTGNATPIKVPTRRLPLHKFETIRKEVEAMMDSDVIEHSCSPSTAPVVLIKKRDGTERFCVDYRKLNEITRKDVYPLPRCEEILESLSGTVYFSHIDLVRGYWQIKVANQVIWASDFSQSVHRKGPPNKNPYCAAARACKLKNP